MDLFFIFCAKYLFVFSFLVAAIWFFRQPRNLQIKIVVFGLACAGVSYLIALIGGQLYYDPRPFVVDHFKPLIDHDTENGFPSDHVLLVSVMAAVVTVFHKKLSVLLWVFASVIGVARVYVGVHHPIDVIASMCIAAGVTFIFYTIFKKRLNTELRGDFFSAKQRPRQKH